MARLFAGILLTIFAAGTAAAQSDALTFEGDTAIMTVGIKADKTADFEQIMQKVQQALRRSENPDHAKQADGWKLVKLAKPLPDGTVAYVHVIHPVVTGADYTILQILYDAFPEEKQALYDQYRGAFDKNLGLITGSVAVP
ncbi:MAG: hypothetical protein AB7I25_13965 [Vicinamibacterales bacterium]